MWKHKPENQKSVEQVSNKIETGAVQAKYDWHIYNMEVTHHQQQAANKGETCRELQQWKSKEYKNKQFPPFNLFSYDIKRFTVFLIWSVCRAPRHISDGLCICTAVFNIPPRMPRQRLLPSTSMARRDWRHLHYGRALKNGFNFPHGFQIGKSSRCFGDTFWSASITVRTCTKRKGGLYGHMIFFTFRAHGLLACDIVMG